MQRPTLLVTLLSTSLLLACGSDSNSASSTDDRAGENAAAKPAEVAKQPAEPTATKGPNGLDCRDLHRKAATLSQAMLTVKQLEGFASIDPTAGPDKMLQNVQKMIAEIQPIPGADETKAELAELDKRIAAYLAADEAARDELTGPVMEQAAKVSPTALITALVHAGCE